MFTRLRSLRFVLLAFAVVLQIGTAQEPRRAKYVFLFIGDGMGIVQRHVTEQVLQHTTGDPSQRLVMNQLPVQGLTTTHSANSPITDSAAADTAPRLRGEDHERHDQPASGRQGPLHHRRGGKGRRDAGGDRDQCVHRPRDPGGLLRPPRGRGDYYEIACALAESGFDYFGGGQAKGDLPAIRQDRPSPVALARERGYQVVDSLAELRQARPGTKVWAYSPVVDSSAALPYEMDREPGAVPLADFVKEGVRLLDNPKGFFLMVEGGKIDWACHVNDPNATVTETLAFDRTIGTALAFQKQHPDETLIVVTADHECGGMTFGRTFTGYTFNPAAIVSQPVSYDKLVPLANRLSKDDTPFSDASVEIRELFGFRILNDWENEVLKKGLALTKVAPKQRGADLQDLQDFGRKEPFAEACLRIVSARAGIAWGSFTHNGTPVQTSAAGVGAERFAGLYDNTDLCNRMREAMGLSKGE